MKKLDEVRDEKALLERIYEPKYGGKDHSGYDTLMKYEVNDEREDCFVKGWNECAKLKDEEIERLNCKLSIANKLKTGYRERLRSKDEEWRKVVEPLVEALNKVIKSAEFFSSHADCKRDTWSCKCSFCRDTESSKNLRNAKEALEDYEKKVKNGL